MRTDLWDDPRIAAMCDTLGTNEATVIGALYRLWSIADGHSTDGRLLGLKPSMVDRKTGVDGFAAAMMSVGWLSVDSNSVTIPEFLVHNGQSAKSRAQSSKRKQVERSKQMSVTLESRSERDSSRAIPRSNSPEQRDVSVTREDESRAEQSKPPPPQYPSALMPSPQSTTEWDVVGVELESIGLGDSLGTIETAKGLGYSPDTIHRLIEFWKRKPGAWGVGAIKWRIEHSPPTRLVDDGWPPATETAKPASQALGPLRSKYDVEFRRCSETRLTEIGRRIGIDAGKLSRLSEVGRDVTFQGDDHERLLLELARENGDLPARGQNAATHDQAG
jgi:hypothetical protein